MSNNVVFIGNIEDQVLGGFTQVTLEEHPLPGTNNVDIHCRVHQTVLPLNHPVSQRVVAMYLEWQDHFSGLVDLDAHLNGVVPPEVYDDTIPKI